MTVAKIADDWSASVERVEEILNHTGPPPEPDETPVTTIAWRLGHLHFGFAGQWEWTYWEWTFGERRQEPSLVGSTPSAALAVERFWAVVDRWRERGCNLEFIHYMAEIALFRALWRTR